MEIQYNTNTFGPAFCLSVTYFCSSVPQKWPPFIKLQSTFHEFLDAQQRRQDKESLCIAVVALIHKLCLNKMKMQYECTVNPCKLKHFHLIETETEALCCSIMRSYAVLVCKHVLLGH